DHSAVALFCTNSPRDEDSFCAEYATDALWEYWRTAALELHWDHQPTEADLYQRAKNFHCFEQYQRKIAAGIVARYLMERSSGWDQELERRFRTFDGPN